jgi:hypothetical protein
VNKGGYLYPYTEKIFQLRSLKTIESLNEAEKYVKKMNYLAALILRKASVVNIYFKDLGIEKYSTDELYTVIDLIGMHFFL